MISVSFVGMLAAAGLSLLSLLTSQTVAQPVTPRELRAIAIDLLGRPPTLAERAEWSQKPPVELVSALVGSAEFWERWQEEQLYYFLLINNFRPQGERIRAQPADLAADKLDVRAAIHRIALSSSFEQRNPGADTFVTVVMEQLAGLEVPKNTRELEIGKKVYDGAAGTFLGQSGRSQSDVVRIAIESPWFDKHFLAREHERLVHVKPEPEALQAWSARFRKDARCFPELVREWLASPAYARRLQSGVPLENRLFVRALYVDLLDRLPTSAEAEPLREALDGLADPAPLRGVYARLILDSGKARLPKREDIAAPAAWIEGLFTRLLGRPPQASEAATFAASLAEPGCRPELVVYALVSSPEYARY